MKILPIALTLAALALSFTGCATPPAARSAGRFITPAPAVGKNPSWTLAPDELATLEAKVGDLLANPDERVFGLGQKLPPHPLSAYFMRYTAAGPLDNKYILAQAALRTSVNEAEFLSPDISDDQAIALASASPDSFSLIYNLKAHRVTELRFPKQP